MKKRVLSDEFSHFDYKSVLRDEDLKEKLLGIKSKYRTLDGKVKKEYS